MNQPTPDPSLEGNWRAASGSGFPSRKGLGAGTCSASRHDLNQRFAPKMRTASVFLWTANLMAACGCGLAQTQKIATQYPSDAPEVPAEVRAEARGQSWQQVERGPVEGLKVFAHEKSGAVWLGGDEGAARFDARAKFRWDRWQFFYGRRWLLDNEVRNMHVDESGPNRKVWISTWK